MTATITYLIAGFLLYTIAFVKSRDAIHPIGIGVLLWFLAAAVSSFVPFYDLKLQVPLDYRTHVAIFFSGVMFFLPALLSGKLRKQSLSSAGIYFTRDYQIIFNTILLLTIMAFLLRFGGAILSPALLSGAGQDLKALVPEALPLINYADIFTPFAALICYFELSFSVKITVRRKVILCLYILFSIAVALAYKVSRGELLVFVLGASYIYLIKNDVRVSLRHVVIVILVISFFFVLGMHRMSENSRVSSQFGDGILNTILSQVYTYMAMNFQNLNSLVISESAPTYFWGAAKFFLKSFFQSSYIDNDMGLKDFSVSFFNAKTYIYYFYNDLGFTGVILYPLLIGCLLQILYNKSLVRVKYFLFIAFFIKAIVFMFFGNYFFGELVLIFPYLVLMVIMLTMRSVGLTDKRTIHPV